MVGEPLIEVYVELSLICINFCKISGFDNQNIAVKWPVASNQFGIEQLLIINIKQIFCIEI